MRCGFLILVGLALVPPVPGQNTSADSAAIVALELEMSRLLAAGQVDEYATHLAPDYARTTQQGNLEERDAALGSWRARGAGAVMRPTDLWWSAGALVACGAPQFEDRGTLTPNPRCPALRAHDTNRMSR
jgi:hypothetical protein